MITDLVLTPGFSAFRTVVGLIADIAVLALAGYTLYITAFSKKLELVSPSFSGSMFYGEEMALTLMNKSLHAIPVQRVFILKYYKGNFYYIDFADFSDPITIDSWGLKRIETKPFTCIDSWTCIGWIQDYHEILKDSVIGIEAGKDLIWVKPCDAALLKKAKSAYKKYNFDILSVFRKSRNDTVISKSVDCVIYVRLKDMNGQFYQRTIFGITGCNHGKEVFLSESLCGYNAIAVTGDSPDIISKAIQDRLGISEENILVCMIGKQ